MGTTWIACVAGFAVTAQLGVLIVSKVVYISRFLRPLAYLGSIILYALASVLSASIFIKRCNRQRKGKLWRFAYLAICYAVSGVAGTGCALLPDQNWVSPVCDPSL